MGKYILSITGKFILMLLIISCKQNPGNNSQSNDIDVYTVGANLTLSGNAAHLGVQVRDGLEFGFMESRELIKDAIIELKVEDNKLNSREAVGIAKRFTELDKVDIMISAYTPVVKATAAIADQAKVPMLATLASAVDVALGKSWVFRDFTTEAINMPMLADYAYNVEAYKQGTYLVVNDDFGRDARRFFELRFTSNGGSLLGGEFFETTDLDLRTKVSKVMSSNPEFVLVVGRGSAMINACRQIREVNPEIRIYSAAGMNDPKIWQGLGDDGNGIVFARIDYDESSEDFVRLNNSFKSKYAYDMSWVNVYGYTIAQYLTKGFSVAGNDREKMKEYLKTLNFESIRGILVMDKNADVITPMKLYLRKDGISVPID